jgi:hypothetical protein
MVRLTQGKEKGLKLKLVPKEGKGCYLVPLTQEDEKSDKYAYLKNLIGSQYFQDTPLKPIEDTKIDDVKIEEVGEEYENSEEVDIDIDPNSINDDQFEVIKALYTEKDSDDLDDDFMIKANLEEVLEEYKENVPDVIQKIDDKELNEALDEFISDHKQMFSDEKKLIMDFEKIPFEQDHVLQSLIDKEISPLVSPVDSDTSEEKDDVVSHTSQYTNTDNRPAVIAIRQPRIKEKKIEKQEVISAEIAKASGKREKNETKEEKKARKDKIKEDKKTIREKKKANKEIKKIEKHNADLRNVGNYDVRQGISVIKLS